MAAVAAAPACARIARLALRLGRGRWDRPPAVGRPRFRGSLAPAASSQVGAAGRAGRSARATPGRCRLGSPDRLTWGPAGTERGRPPGLPTSGVRWWWGGGVAPPAQIPTFQPENGEREKAASPRGTSPTPAAGVAGCGRRGAEPLPCVCVSPRAPRPGSAVGPARPGGGRGRRGVEARGCRRGSRRQPGQGGGGGRGGARKGPPRPRPSAQAAPGGRDESRSSAAPAPAHPPAAPAHRTATGGVPAPRNPRLPWCPPPPHPPAMPATEQAAALAASMPEAAPPPRPDAPPGPPGPAGPPLSAPGGRGRPQPLPAVPGARPGAGLARFGTARHAASEAGQAATLLPPPWGDGDFLRDPPPCRGWPSGGLRPLLTGSAGGRGPAGVPRGGGGRVAGEREGSQSH